MKLTAYQKQRIQSMALDFIQKYDADSLTTAYACCELPGIGHIWIAANPPEFDQRERPDDV